MKKLFFLTLILLLDTIAALAQDRWTVDVNKYTGETVIYTKLVPTDRTNFSEKFYEVAAFIDGEARDVGMPGGYDKGILFVLHVKGNDTDKGKTITFKARNGVTGVEYNLTLDEGVAPVTYDGKTKNGELNPLKLNFTPVTALSLPESITVGKGKTVDLTKLVTVTPAGAALPSNLEWDFANSSYYIKVENNVLTGLNICEEAYLGLRAGRLGAYTLVTVNNPVTAINIKSDHTAITVNKGDGKTLTDFLNNAYTLTPADGEGQVTWAIADTKIVQDLAPTAYGYRPIAAGTTTLTARIMDPDGKIRISANQKVTVTVVVPLESISFNFNHNLFECNVGDDLTDYLNSILAFSPGDASNRKVTWSVNAGDAVTIQNGQIKAVKAGTASIRVSSVENTKIVADLRITVHNPATDVQFTNSTVNTNYLGSAKDISQLLTDNIKFLPVGFESISNLTITSSRPNDVVSVGQTEFSNGKLTLTAQAIGVGDSKITVSFIYPDYLTTYSSGGKTMMTKTVSKSFNVHVDALANAININSNHNQEECNVGDDLTTYLNSIIEVLPSNAPDKSVKWSVLRGDAVTISNSGNIKASKAGIALLQVSSVANPQATATVTVLVHNPATDIQFANTTIGMEYHGSEADISGDIKKNISFLPKGFESLEGLSITSDKPAVVSVSNVSYSNNALNLISKLLGVGTAKITVTISYRDYLADYTQPATTEHRKTVSKAFTVNVTQGSIPVSSLRNISSRQVEECNVGNDLTSYLNSLIEVLPANATNKQFTWSLAAGTAGNAVTIGNDGTIKATTAGQATLVATSKDNPQATATVTVLVHNPATDIQFANATIGMEYHGSEADISGDIKNNISFLPKGFESLEGLSVTSDKPAVVSVSNVSYSNNTLNLTSKLLGVGTAKITVTISYRDYLADYTQPATTEHRKTVSKAFTVNVIQGTIPVSSLRNTSSRQVEECNVGNDLTSHLNSLIEVQPANATNKQFTWSVAAGTAGNAVTIGSDGTIKAASAGRATLVATSKDNPQATATVSVLVHNPATDIQFANATIGMEYHGSEADISGDIKRNISFLPKGFESIDGLSVTSDKPAVVSVSNVSFSNNTLNLTSKLLGVGTAKITVNISYRDYLADYTQPATTEHRKTVSKAFTVNVIQGTIPVSSLRNTSSRQVEECNVGNDLTSHLNSLIEVQPANATNKQFTWSVAAGTAGNAVTIGSDGTIKAASAGRATLVATSKDDPQATATVSVLVHNPATDIQFANATIGMEYHGSEADISGDIKRNISFLPKGFESIDGLSVTSDKPAVVSVSNVSYANNTLNLTSKLLGIGTAKITVAITYRDYLADYTQPATTEHKQTVTKTFTVNVTQGTIPVSSLRNTSSRQVEECNVGNDLTSYLNSLIEVLPANATNKQFTWSLAAGTAGNAVTIGSDGTIKATTVGQATLVATSKDNPQATATVTVLVHNPATDIQFASQTISMEYHDSEADISSDIKKNITFLPKGFEGLEGLSVTSDKPAVVSVSNVSYSNNALNLTSKLLGVGTAKITVTISYRDYLADYTNPATTEHRKTVTKTFTVNVTQGSIPVKSVENTSNRRIEECNVGDDLTSYLNSLIKVLPDNATNKQFTWSLAAGTAGNAVTIGNDGTIKATAAGQATLVTTSKDNPQATATVTVLVHNPATDIQFANATIGMEYHGSEADISGDIKKNISFLPKGFESLEGLSVTSDKPAVVTISSASYANNALSLKASMKGVGTTKITVTITYRDYLADYTQPATTEHKQTVTKTFTVNVTQGSIPVSSLRNTSSRQVEECNVGNDLTSYLNSLIEVLPSNATNKQYTWSVAVGTAGNTVTIGNDGTIKAASAGQATLVATSKDNPQATATVSVLVHNPATDIQFANQTISVTKYEGIDLDISEQLQENITFLSQDFESVSGLTVTSNRPNDVAVIDDASYSEKLGIVLVARAIGGGEATIAVSINYRDYLADYMTPTTTEHRQTITKTFTVIVTEEKPQFASLTYPDELTLSRFHDVALNLKVVPEGIQLIPDLIEIRIEESPNAGWGAAATATPSPASSTVWNMRGRFTGAYLYSIYYNGQPQLTESGRAQGRLLIPAEYPFEHGWDWISLYAVGSSGALPLHTTTGWVAPMQVDDDNYVAEIRSQSGLLYNDPQSGFFGDIEQLLPEDGMYKIRSRYSNEVQNQMIFSAGYNGLVSASTRRLPQARKGYTWITYPHELNHTLDVLAPYLTLSAQNGDMIIGRDAFIFYDGDQWIGPNDFVFEAGKGYIYYTESTEPKSIQWGPAILPPDDTPPVAHARQAPTAVAPWTYDAYSNPDCMAVIAAIEGTTTPNDYMVGAFVGDECRGISRLVGNDGLLFIPVSGQPGERVTFRLYHQPTGSVLPIADISLHFAARYGSLETPLTLSADATAIGTAGTGNLSVTIRDNIITASSAAGQTFLTVTDVQGKQVANCQGATLSLVQLPEGVYIVHVTDGYQQVTKKIKK